MNPLGNLSSDRSLDNDHEETREWIDALEAVLSRCGPDRAAYLIETLLKTAELHRIPIKRVRVTPYVNSLPPSHDQQFPGGETALDLEERIASIMRWNALAMVVRANRFASELGGHIASYASAADLFEVGFNHFFRAKSDKFGGDLIFFQPHSAPGIYARAFLEGTLSENNLGFYRREIEARKEGIQGLSSYPHPWLMPDFWQFPTGSMGLGPLMAIYQARFMRYLENRSLIPQQPRKVWGIFGDGEMDEPESLAALSMAAREKLDNIIFVINCNLQRLDGPVRGNGHIVDELETLFTGAGWNVIKLLWGSDWDPLFAGDDSGELIRILGLTPDGQLQTFAANDGRYNREKFFGQNTRLKAIGDALSDDEIDRLKRGGHDMRKIYSAYLSASHHKGSPTVILAQTKKGFGMGRAGQGRMTTHQQKKLETADLLEFRDRFGLPLSDQAVESLAFYHPGPESDEIKHLLARRTALGGFIPRRTANCCSLAVPALSAYADFALHSAGKEMSTTMAAVRLMGNLLKIPKFGSYIVPIVADEARTFGMANLFRQVGIYSAQGQTYEPEDIGSILAYREAKDGQILEEGITEAGAMASWIAAATSYAIYGIPTIPFYIYYSIFGFQRVGDLIWAAADQRARGFLLGATSGRTTLAGEGLQHQDGSSHLIASTIPNCISYDPAYAYELAVIIDHGMKKMIAEQEDVFFYVTVTNQSQTHPTMPSGCEEGILRGMHCVHNVSQPDIRLLGSGAILSEVLRSASMLAEIHGISAEVWSVTSWSELARQGMRRDRETLEGKQSEEPWVTRSLGAHSTPVLAVSDYVRALPEMIRAYIPAAYETLGTDGFGMSDTRENLRDEFRISASWITKAACRLLGNGAT